MSRTYNSLRNIKFSLVGLFVYMLLTYFARIVFLKYLNAEYLGLNGLFYDILSLLSIADFGIATAISYCLYKPLSDHDETKILSIMMFFKKAYIIIGCIIFVAGIVLSFFLSFFIKDMPDIPHINIYFLMFVANTALPYFFSYKQILIIADQKKYISDTYQYAFFSGLCISQIIILMLTKNYFLFLLLQVITTFLRSIFLTMKANKLFPFIKKAQYKKLDSEEKKHISKNVKAMLYHKIGGVVVNGTNNIILSKFISLISVALYSNYLLIINAITTVIHSVFNSLTASVGNLATHSDSDKNTSVFSITNFACFWIYGFSSICLFVLINPFIKLWIGEYYLFSDLIVLSIIVNFYINGMRLSVLTFRDAMGIFWFDRYKPLFEAIINLVASIILAIKLGIAGVFIGSIISTVTTAFWIEPLMLFRHGFKKPVYKYFTNYILYLFITSVTGVITFYTSSLIIISSTIIEFLCKLGICMVIPNLIFFLIFHKTKEFIYIKDIVVSVLKKRPAAS